MNHADMKLERILWRANINTHSVHIDTAAVRVINAGKHIHQSRFAASVFTQKGQNLSLANVQRNVFVCSYCINFEFIRVKARHGESLCSD